MNASLALAVAAIVIAPLVGLLTASRKLSGKIATSEASELWAESSSIREDYRQRLAAAETRTAAMEARIAQLERDNLDLARENLGLRQQIASLKWREVT